LPLAPGRVNSFVSLCITNDSCGITMKGQAKRPSRAAG